MGMALVTRLRFLVAMTRQLAIMILMLRTMMAVAITVHAMKQPL